ncbi:MAG: hypothetical protein WA718_01230 [Terriglobales bacterium]
MLSGETPANSRLLLANRKSSFSAAESSAEDSPAAELELGVGNLLLTEVGDSLRVVVSAEAVETTCAALMVAHAANIANKTNTARSMIVGLAFRPGGCR